MNENKEEQKLRGMDAQTESPILNRTVPPTLHKQTITTQNGQLHLIAFHPWTFSAPELNYNVHNKELLTNFEAFK